MIILNTRFRPIFCVSAGASKIIETSILVENSAGQNEVYQGCMSDHDWKCEFLPEPTHRGEELLECIIEYGKKLTYKKALEHFPCLSETKYNEG